MQGSPESGTRCFMIAARNPTSTSHSSSRCETVNSVSSFHTMQMCRGTFLLAAKQAVLWKEQSFYPLEKFHVIQPLLILFKNGSNLGQFWRFLWIFRRVHLFLDDSNLDVSKRPTFMVLPKMRQ